MKQTSVQRWPAVLVIHLNRFAAASTAAARKLSDTVIFPIDGLDLSEFSSQRSAAASASAVAANEPSLRHASSSPHLLEPLVSGGGLSASSAVAGCNAGERVLYDLIGVVNHVGDIGHGHYTA